MKAALIKAALFGGLLIGSLTAFALPASASAVPNCCSPINPPIENLQYVWNSTCQPETVTLTGNYYWVQTQPFPGGPTTFLGPKTTTVVLDPGEGLSVAWGGPQHPATAAGPHYWVWTGAQETCGLPHHFPVTNPCHPKCSPSPPCKPVIPCRHDDHGEHHDFR